MPSCVLRYCTYTSKNIDKASGITFHRFLRPGHENREKWIKFVQNNRSEESWLPSEHSYICSTHFKVDDFYKTESGRRFLKKSAIPCNSTIEQIVIDATPPSSDNISVSNSELVFDTPQIITLKQDLEKAKEIQQLYVKKNKKLQRQNRNLHQKNKTLIAVVKELKKRIWNQQRRRKNIGKGSRNSGIVL